MPSMSSKEKGSSSAFRKSKHRHRRDRDDSDSDQPSSFSQTLSSFISPRVSTLTSVAPPMVLPPAPPPAPTPPLHNLPVPGSQTSSSASSINYEASIYSNHGALIPISNGIPAPAPPPPPAVRTSSRRSGTAKTSGSGSSNSSGTVVPAPPSPGSSSTFISRIRARMARFLALPAAPVIRWTKFILLPILCLAFTFLGITLAAFVSPYVPLARYKFESAVVSVYDKLPSNPTQLINVPFLPVGFLNSGNATGLPLSSIPTSRVTTNPSIPGALTVEYFATEGLHCTIDTRPPYNAPSSVNLKLVKSCMNTQALPHQQDASAAPGEAVQKFTCPKELDFGTFLYGEKEDCWRKCKELCLVKGVKAKSGKVECAIKQGLGRCWAAYKF